MTSETDLGTKFDFYVQTRAERGEKFLYTATKLSGGLWNIEWTYLPSGRRGDTLYETKDVISNIRDGRWTVTRVWWPHSEIPQPKTLQNDSAGGLLARINSLQNKGVALLFSPDLTINARFTASGTPTGVLGLCRTPEELSQTLARVERELGV